MALSARLAAMKLFAALGGLIALLYLAVWALCVVAIGYVAWEILFDSALNRWFG